MRLVADGVEDSHCDAAAVLTALLAMQGYGTT
jgi:hypothetical protein